VSDILQKLHPADPIVIDQGITIDGVGTIRANAIQIDVWRSDFDRRAATSNTPGSNDPPIELLFGILNSYLDRARSVGRAHVVHRVEQGASCWRLEFLSDAEEELSPGLGKARARNGASFTMTIAGLTPALWQAACQLPANFQPKAWETLLLDAEAHLPAIVPSIFLAAAALETLIAAALIALAPSERMPAELWEFINNRGDYRKEASVAEQFDQLLHALTGHSLKEKPDLWEAFRNIREAPNTLMHEGSMVVGNAEVTRVQAFAFIVRTKEIADWIEEFLPPHAKRSPLGPLMQMQVSRALILNPPSPAI